MCSSLTFYCNFIAFMSYGAYHLLTNYEFWSCFKYLGEIINERDRCRGCLGKKVKEELKMMEVHIDKGMRDGQKIVFRGEGDQMVCI